MISSVIDIGSNSIKLLVAEGENAEPVFEQLNEIRLSPPAEGSRERISGECFAAGVKAVCELCDIARRFSPSRNAIVGTSLFRTAENAEEFARAVGAATGTPMQILSGIEEAELVASGVSTDPSVRLPCAIFDLGGGSLEFISKTGEKGSEIFATSRQLGAVRMTRKFLKNPLLPVPEEEISALRAFVRNELADILRTKIPDRAQIVFCGGSANVCTNLISEKSAQAIESLLKRICALPFENRLKSGVPAKRADIFPAALATFSEVCAISGISEFTYTDRNLRYGLCSRMNSGIVEKNL